MAYSVIAWRWFRFRDRPLSDVTAREVANFLGSLKKTHAANTVRNFTTSLRSFFKFCVTEGLREDDPTKSMSTKKPKTQPRQPYSTAELRAMNREIISPVDRALFLLLLTTGIRIGELMRIRCQDIDTDRSVILITGKGSKERWIPVTPTVVKPLQELIGIRKAGPIFLTQDGRPMSRERARKRLVALGEKSGVVHVYPHRWRVTFANVFLEQGGDLGALQSVLGHEEITTTNHYAGYSRAQRGLDQTRRLDLARKLLA